MTYQYKANNNKTNNKNYIDNEINICNKNNNIKKKREK